MHWRKAALVIVLMSKRVGRAPDDELGHEIAARIVALVHAGRLEAQGNLARWRYSEVRLPSGATLP